MASSVTFPVSESPQKQSKVPPHSRPPHLPFRRISLPTAPSFGHRESVFSIASVDSLPEGDDDPAAPPPRAGAIAIVGLKGNGEGRSTRPMTVESPRKRKRTRDSTSKPPDDKLLMKRKRIFDEFYETEVAYVDGLDLIYDHFLTPIINSLETSEPLLNRPVLTSIFSNFIDIWNFHRSFLAALTGLLKPSSDKPNGVTVPPNMASLLLAHFPYLSLYTPFITSFPTTITALTELVSAPTAIRPNPQYNARFANFLTTQEADRRCGKLKLRDWLLTIVQRCPRYLLLLKDLINNTGKEDPEHAQLTAVHTLAAKITSSLNTSLHTHAQTLSLLALQKATPNLPFQLISPGRNLIKRGTLIQVDRNHDPVDREFLLFSDCLLWLAPADTSTSSWSWSGSGSGASQSSQIQNPPPPPGPETMTRTRSKSDAELATMRAVNGHQDEDESPGPSPSTPASSPTKMGRRRSQYHVEPPPPPSMGKRTASTDDKWVYKGRADLVDIDVVVGSALEGDRRFEILSPGGSFAVYAPSEKGRDEWTSEIRAAKQQLLISLNVMNPNSTLTSSSSTNHVRRVLQALPYPPSDDRVTTVKASGSLDLLHHSSNPLSSRLGKFGGKKDKAKEKDDKKNHEVLVERRRKVEHWVPPVWIPDSKTSSCMRCGRMFGWRRRRHHCRLCGRCVCAACSGRTFFITEPTSKGGHSSKPARACEACYETVFPRINDGEGKIDYHPEDTNEHQRHNSDTITSLAHLPSWLSMPALPVQRQPQSLMAIDMNSSHDLSSLASGTRANGVEEKERMARMRFKAHHRLRSSQQILGDFQEHAMIAKQETGQTGGAGDETAVEDHHQEEEDDDDDPFGDDVFSSPLRSFPSSPMRKEDTARRSKRFSLPAVALHATNVTARMTEGVVGNVSNDEQTGGFMAGEMSSNSPARHRRFSLVLIGRNSHYVDDGGGVRVNRNEGEDGGDLGKGMAAVKLADLLKKSRAAVGN